MFSLYTEDNSMFLEVRDYVRNAMSANPFTNALVFLSVGLVVGAYLGFML